MQKHDAPAQEWVDNRTLLDWRPGLAIYRCPNEKCGIIQTLLDGESCKACGYAILSEPLPGLPPVWESPFLVPAAESPAPVAGKARRPGAASHKPFPPRRLK